MRLERRCLHAFAAALAALTALSGCLDGPRTARVKRGELLKVVSGIGKIHGIQEAMISAETRGKLLVWFVGEGQFAKKGEPVGELQDAELQARLEEAKIDLDDRRRSFARKSVLHQRKAIPGEEFEDAQFALMRAQASYDQIAARAGMLWLRAPFDGMVIRHYRQPGEEVNPQQPAFLIADIRQLKFSIEIDESDISFVRPGQSLQLALDGVPGSRLAATVSKVGQIVQKKRDSMGDSSEVVDAKVVVVDATLPYEPDLKIGLTGTGYIQIAHLTDSLLVPKAAVQSDDSGAFCMVARGGVVQRRKLALGVFDDRNYEVKGGLTEGEEVVSGP